VENAVRFGAEAVIGLRISQDQLTIDVEDDGPGISDALKQNMLEPLVRGDDARNMDEAEGFGLGLSITNAIATAHGRRAVAARPAAAWAGGSDAIADPPVQQPLSGLEDDDVRRQAASASGCASS
jgi:K+-sensing histidine kinase KdpD